MVFVWHCWTVQESTGVVLDHLAKYIHHPENRFTIHNIHIKTNISPTISPETDVFLNVFFAWFPGSLHPSHSLVDGAFRFVRQGEILQLMRQDPEKSNHWMMKF